MITVLAQKNTIAEALSQCPPFAGAVRWCGSVAALEQVDTDFLIVDGDDFDAGLFLRQPNLLVLSSAETEGQLRKPLYIGELLAALTVRISSPADMETKVGAYHFNYSRKTLVGAGGLIELTEKEAGIIQALLDAAPHPLDKKELLSQVWGYADAVDTHTLETHIYRLRKKIGGMDDLIVTDKDGYKIVGRRN